MLGFFVLFGKLKKQKKEIIIQRICFYMLIIGLLGEYRSSCELGVAYVIKGAIVKITIYPLFACLFLQYD